LCSKENGKRKMVVHLQNRAPQTLNLPDSCKG
jgi:hypothetical protein